MRFYLIQKGKFRKEENERYQGIDRFVELGYMGYAEYEFGALPAALKSMTKDFDNMEFFTYTFRKTKNRPETKTITILANIKEEGTKEEIIQNIKNIGNEKQYTKGYTWFPSFLYSTSDERIDSDFWWNIEDNVMFFADDDEKTNQRKIEIAFANLKEKWKDELFPPKPFNLKERISRCFSKRKVAN